MTKLSPRPRSFLMALEPRWMFDAAAAADAVDVSHAAEAASQADQGASAPHQDSSDAAAPDSPVAVDSAAEPATGQTREIVFIDGAISEPSQLAGFVRPGVEVVTLDPGRDGFAQIQQYLSGRGAFDAIHIIGHAAAGQAMLGTASLSDATFEAERSALQGIGQALAGNGDLLFYGCNLAEGPAGSALIGRIAQVTGADIAASDDLTGAAARGGDWQLEGRAGSVEASTAFDPSRIVQWDALLSTAPDVDAVGDIVINEDQTATVVIDLVDPDTDLGLINVTATSSDTTLLPNANISVAGSGNQRTITLTPATNRSGETTITLTLSDGTNTTQRSFVVFVRDEPDPPTDLTISMTIAAESVTAGSTVATFTTADPDGNLDSFTYHITGGTGQNVFSIVDDRLIVRPGEMLNFEAATSYSVTIRSTDSAGNTISRDFTIAITDVNEAPTATNLNQSHSYTEDGAEIDLTDIVVGDDDVGDVVTASLTLANTQAGQLTGSAGGTYDANTGIWTITGNASTVSQALAGIRFVPTANAAISTQIAVSIRDGGEDGAVTRTGTIQITAVPVADDPTVTSPTITEDTASVAVTLTRNAVDGAEVGHYQITNITLGRLYLDAGLVTEVTDNQFIISSGATTILYFVPNANAHGDGGFSAQAATSASIAGLAGAVVRSTVTVTPIAEAPSIDALTIVEDHDSGAIVITRDAADGAEVTHWRITDIVGGEVFADAAFTQEIADGGFVASAGAGTSVYFRPNQDFFGNASFKVSGATAANAGATSAASTLVPITVTGVNDAPVISAHARSLTSVAEDAATNQGSLVSAILSSAGTLAEPDGESVGIAVTGVTDTNGTWEYSVDGGNTWAAVAGVSSAQALLLSATDRIRFQANANYHGSATGGITFRGWDGTVGAHDDRVDLSAEPGGGDRAYSIGQATAGITITPVADDVTASNATTQEDQITGAITLTRSGLDGAEITHFKITGITGGTVYLDAAGTQAVAEGGFVAANGATATVYFKPSPSFTGTASFKAQGATADQDSAVAGTAATSSITVSPVNDAPLITAPASAQVAEDVASAITGISFADVDGGTGTVTATLSVGAGNGTLTVRSDVADGLGAGQISGNGTHSLTLTGTLAQINATLAASNGLTYTTPADQTISRTLTIGMDDGGNSGAGGAMQADPKMVTLNVSKTADAPTVSSLTINEDAASGTLTITRAAVDGAEVTYYRITDIVGGTLYRDAGLIQQINGNDFIASGGTTTTIYFKPTANVSGTGAGSFKIQGSTSDGSDGLGGTQAQATIDITPIADGISVTNRQVTEDTLSGAITVTRHASDGAEITHFQVSGITGGTVYSDAAGTVQVANGTYVAFDANGTKVLYFRPSENRNQDASFDVQAANSGSGGTGGAKATSTITIDPVNDILSMTVASTPVVIEQQTIFLNGISFSDPDNGTSSSYDAAKQAKVTISTAVGDSITFNTGVVAGWSGTISGNTITATLAQINELFRDNGVRFNHGTNSGADTSITITRNDMGNGGPGSGGDNAQSVTIDVTPVNDAPITDPVIGISGYTFFDAVPGSGFSGTKVLTFTASPGPGDEYSSQQITGATITSWDTNFFQSAPVLTFTQGSGTVTFSVSVTAKSGHGASGTFTVRFTDNGDTTNGGVRTFDRTYTVEEGPDRPPAVPTSLSVQENGTFVFAPSTNSYGYPTPTLTITGGADSGLFEIVNNSLVFKTNPDYENPPTSASNPGGRTYQVTLQSVNIWGTDTKTITVTLTNQGSPTFAGTTMYAGENQNAISYTNHGSAASWSGSVVPPYTNSGATTEIIGGADADKFEIVSNQIRFKAGFTPNYESPGSAAGTNTYQVILRISATEDASTGIYSAQATVNIVVVDRNDELSVTQGTTSAPYTEDIVAALPDITFSDQDPSQTYTGYVRLHANTDFGTLTNLSGTTYSSTTANQTWSFSGLTKAQVQALVNGAQFDSATNVYSSATYELVVDESSGGGTDFSSKSYSWTLTPTSVGDLPTIVDDGTGNAAITVIEDTLSNAIRIRRNDVDGSEISHYQLTAITGGKLYADAAMTQEIALNGFVATFGLRDRLVYFKPDADRNANASFTLRPDNNAVSDGAGATVTATIQITPRADAPTVSNVTVTEDGTSGVITVTRAAVDGATTTHVKITDVVGGTLYRDVNGNNTYDAGTDTAIVPGDFYALSSGTLKLFYKANADYNTNGSFKIRAATGSADGDLDGDTKTVTVNLTPIADSPAITSATINEDESTPIVITRNAVDGAEVTHYQVTAITGGTVYTDAALTQAVTANSFIASAGATTTLYFKPNANFFGAAQFTVQAATGATAGQLGGATATSTITVNSVADAPSVTGTTTFNENTTIQYVLNRNAADGAETTHIQVSGFGNGKLYSDAALTTLISDGAFLSLAGGPINVWFKPSEDYHGAAGFQARGSKTGDATGLGGTNDVALTVIDINSPPRLTGPAAYAMTEDTSKVLEELSIGDVDANGAVIVVSFSVGAGNGALTLLDNVANGLAAADISGNGSHTVTVTGTIAAINATLAGQGALTYAPGAGVHGAKTLTVTMNDQGNTGLHGSGDVSQTIPLNIQAIADTPSVASGLTIQEDTDSGAIAITRNATDGAEVTHYRITNLVGGVLYRDANFTQAIAAGDFIASAGATTNVYFRPTLDFFGTAKFTVQASTSDQASGLGGDALEASITVNGVQDSPVLSNHARSLSNVAEEVGGGAANPGTTVAAILASVGTASDPDNEVIGMAIQGVDSSKGTWQFSTDGGNSWSAIVGVDAQNALLLAPTNKIRFIPNQDYVGTTAGGLTFRAWDQTVGVAGTKTGNDTTPNAGTGAGLQFSSATTTAQITVTPINDAPTDISISTGSIVENSPPGTVVATFTTADVDLGDPVPDSHTYAVIGGTGLGVFTVQGDKLVVAPGQTLDFETQNSYTVVIRATDAAGVSVEKTLTIGITDANDAPHAIALSSLNVPENQAGATIGTIEGADQDGDALSYSIASDPSNKFEVVGNVLKLKNDVTLNFEQTSSFSVTLRASDGTTTFDRTFTLAVLDLNDTPTITRTASYKIYEDSSLGVLLNVGDEDAANPAASLSITVTSDNQTVAPSSAFAVEVAGGRRTLTFTPPANANGSALITVTVSDGRGGTRSSTFSVEVIPVNDAPINAPGTMPPLFKDEGPRPIPVSSLLGGTRDVDGSSALKGMAIHSVDTSIGIWEYTTDGGVTWQAVTGVSKTNALLLRGDDPQTQLRFTANPGVTGTGRLSYHAWDQTTGTAGQFADTGVNGKTTAFSAASADALVSVIERPPVQPPPPPPPPVINETPVAVAPPPPPPPVLTIVRATDSGGALAARDIQTSSSGLNSVAGIGTPIGFRVATFSDSGRSGEGLVAVKPITEVSSDTGRINYALPTDTFAHSNPQAVVQLVATQADGQNLPSWLSFNPATGTFVGQAPVGLKGEVLVRVVARDGDGREAVAVVRLNLSGSGDVQAAPQGQPGNTQQGGQPVPASQQEGGGPPQGQQEGAAETPDSADGEEVAEEAQDGDLGKIIELPRDRGVGKPALAEQMRSAQLAGPFGTRSALAEAAQRVLAQRG